MNAHEFALWATWNASVPAPPPPRDRYLRERRALASREGEMVEITRFGGPPEFLACGPSCDDFLALAKRAYVRGDLSVEEFETEVGELLGTDERP